MSDERATWRHILFNTEGVLLEMPTEDVYQFALLLSLPDQQRSHLVHSAMAELRNRAAKGGAK